MKKVLGVVFVLVSGCATGLTGGMVRYNACAVGQGDSANPYRFTCGDKTMSCTKEDDTHLSCSGAGSSTHLCTRLDQKDPTSLICET